ncbi:magnesium-dependent phosphatase-1 [Acidiplasma sp.]|uniref:magnesium-dependent phosphatase-1 n=1 Tax=Acidiplasma sp. TaxID=1872114 RepID=UPI002588F910|nr:magnesium-dependent phosphatase-1 [Acidiplasma sp.]
MEGKPWLLAMDLDGTVWDNLNISGINPPYEKIDSEKIRGENTVVTIYKSAVEFMIWCKRHGAIITSLSWNKKEHAMEALEKFGIIDLFDYNATDYTPDKDKRLLDLINILKANGINITPDRIVYIDDRDIHMDAIKKSVGDIIFINIWKTAKNYDEAKDVIKKKILGYETTA